jgi:hypothetical protein
MGSLMPMALSVAMPVTIKLIRPETKKPCMIGAALGGKNGFIKVP